MLMKLGVKRNNIWLCDLNSLVYQCHDIDMNPQKAAFVQASEMRSLDEVIEGADMFLGLSGPNVLRPDLVKQMSAQPIIFALANSTPEIIPADALAIAPDAIIATGRSDCLNQVNDVFCIPFIFRRASAAGATEISGAVQVPPLEGF